jgi:hypothetical protein
MLDLKFNQFDLSTPEGMLLLASVSILTSGVDENKYGPNKSPDEVFEHIQDLANRIFYEEEFKVVQKQNQRDKKINDIL